MLLEAGRPAEAEKAFREDLVRRPENGWSLHGLAQSLRAQKRRQGGGGSRGQVREGVVEADMKASSSERYREAYL